MKTIASLEGPDFLRACNRARHAVSEFLEQTGVAELRKVMPEIPEGASEEEKEKLFEAQWKKNVSAMLDCVLEEHPEETFALVMALMVPEDGKEVNPTGMDVIVAGFDLITEPKVMDFLFRLAKSGLLNMED